ncbi:MAG: diguanylate cyclase [Sulfurimonas sp.]|jgi:diguanylate cyclase
MQIDKNKLKIISNETKKSINQLSVVTPSMYASIFSKYAKENNTIIDNEQELSKELFTIECSNLTDLQKQASHNAITLSDNTTKAINAIKIKDEKILEKILKETEELRREIEKLKTSVYKDALTNTKNRKWLNDNLLEEDEESFREAGTLAMIDLNYFKIINDTFGHIIGDKVLIYIAKQLKNTKNNVVRYGGDEFLIMFPAEATTSKASSILNNMREDIIHKKVKTQDDSFHVSFSLGICQYKAGYKFSDVIQSADKDMYKDKIEIKKRITGI